MNFEILEFNADGESVSIIGPFDAIAEAADFFEAAGYSVGEPGFAIVDDYGHEVTPDRLVW